MLLYSAEGRPRAPIGRIGTDPRWCSYGGGLGVLRQARVGAASGRPVLPEGDQPPDVEAAVFSYRQSSLSRDCHGAPRLVEVNRPTAHSRPEPLIIGANAPTLL